MPCARYVSDHSRNPPPPPVDQEPMLRANPGDGHVRVTKERWDPLEYQC